MRPNYEEITFFEFKKKYVTESDCRDKLFKMKWSDGYVCPKCGHKEYYSIKKRHLYQCKKCRYQASVTSGTIMHRSRTPLVKWFWAIYLVSTDKRGVSAVGLSKQLSLYYKVAWLMLHKIRKAMMDRDNKYKLKWVVEMDETFIGSPSKGNKKRGRGSDKSKVIVSVSTKNDSVYFVKMDVVDKVDTENIKRIISEKVENNQVVKTDGWRAYNIANNLGHEHNVINIKKSGQKAHEIFKWVHIVASNVKSFIDGTLHGLDEKHLQSYLAEFCYRFNRRFWENQLFDRLLFASIISKGVTYDVLKG